MFNLAIGKRLTKQSHILWQKPCSGNVEFAKLFQPQQGANTLFGHISPKQAYSRKRGKFNNSGSSLSVMTVVPEISKASRLVR